VAAAKKLTEHLRAKGTIDADAEVKPQVVYSYIKNTKGGKNPIPTYEVGGRSNLLKLDEFLAWWDAKDERVRASKAAAAAKAEAKAARAAAAPAAASAEVVEAEATEVVEAE
jgi:hypothetical protein